MDKYLSIITNFGCHYTCPYCIVKNNNLNSPKTTIGGLDKLVENIRKYDCNWVSVSGGGDPLYCLNEHKDWYRELIFKVPHDVKLELHTSYISDVAYPVNLFDRVVYHCKKPKDLFKIRKQDPNQITRAVFVVTGNFTPELINDISAICKHNPQIDELSFRQMVDSNYIPTHYCDDYLKAGHQKDWWYIEQNDYNIYYAENEVGFKFEDFK